MANNPVSDKLLARLKGLRAQMREYEQPLFSIPAIWDNATDRQSNACDLVMTNQRIFGYIYKTFPREWLFLDALELSEITTISIRRKSFEAMFRELLVADKNKRVYIRATGKKIEETYTALRKAIADYAPAAQATLTTDSTQHAAIKISEPPTSSPAKPEDTAQSTQIQEQSEPVARTSAPNEPTYRQEHIHQPLRRSPLGITLLLVGGLILEIFGVLAWATTGDTSVGIPLILTGLFAVIIAIFSRRQLR